MLEKAHYLLRPFCLRRLKEDVEKTLPPRVSCLACSGSCPEHHPVICISSHLTLTTTAGARSVGWHD